MLKTFYLRHVKAEDARKRIENLGLVIGVMSYNGKVCWGLNADADRVPDLADFAALIPKAFERLAGAAGVRVQGARPIAVRSAPAAG